MEPAARSRAAPTAERSRSTPRPRPTAINARSRSLRFRRTRRHWSVRGPTRPELNLFQLPLQLRILPHHHPSTPSRAAPPGSRSDRRPGRRGPEQWPGSGAPRQQWPEPPGTVGNVATAARRAPFPHESCCTGAWRGSSPRPAANMPASIPAGSRSLQRRRFLIMDGRTPCYASGCDLGGGHQILFQV